MAEILSLTTNCLQFQFSGPVGIRNDNSPPIRNGCFKLRQVPRSRYDRHGIEHLSVHMRLRRQSVQIILITFYLETLQLTIHNRDVHAGYSRANPKLINDQRPWLITGGRDKALTQSASNIALTHGVLTIPEVPRRHSPQNSICPKRT